MASDEALNLLPTPAVNDMGEGKTVEAWDEWTAKMKSAHGNGNGHGNSLAIEAQRLAGEPISDGLTRLFPTPSVADSEGGHERRGGARGNELLLNGVAKELAVLLPTPTTMDAHASGGGYNGQNNVTLTDATVRQTHGPAWGDYAPAIARWERALGRPAPEPTMTSTKGNPQLSPRFVEWLMGLPPGWVTDAPGVTRNEALKALGNGVVPQQAAEALRVMESWAVAT